MAQGMYIHDQAHQNMTSLCPYDWWSWGWCCWGSVLHSQLETSRRRSRRI